MRLVSVHMRGSVARDKIFSLIWKCYGPKRDMLGYWVTLISRILPYYIIPMDKG